jgi:hypothetical protein
MPQPDTLKFRQWPGEPGTAHRHSSSEAYLLRSLDPPGEAGQVLFGGAFENPATAPVGMQAYAGELVQDSGPFEGHAPIIMLVAFAVPKHLRGEVDRWYVEEHVPLLMRAPGWMRARRYEVTQSGAKMRRFTSLAFHQLADVSVLASRERALARSTKWRARLERGGSWFGEAGRWVYACI